MPELTPGQTISVNTLLHIIRLQRETVTATNKPGPDLDSYTNALADLTTLIRQYVATEIK